MRTRLAVTLCLAVSAAGCGPTVDVPEKNLAAEQDAIIGGVTDSTDTNVFMVYMQGNNGQGGSCSATLIDRRTLMLAAHCVDPAISGATSLQLYAHNKVSEQQAFQSDYIRITETRAHPGWNAQTLQDDISLALLERAPANVTPKPWNKASLDNKSGATVRAVGYGLSDPAGTGAGLRRTVDLTITQVYPTLIRMGNGSTKGICQGDSGGPTFMTFPDGVERAVGVHSFTTSMTCTDGADTRVDAYQPFIQQWLTEKEAPTCGEDGRCAANCPTVDYDCVCPADGLCTTTCPNLLKDPDCPKDCVADGVCSLSACPAPDVDCQNLGQPCANANVCPGRLCITDSLHPAPYCSRSCTDDSNCTNGLSCDQAAHICVWPQVPPSKEGDACVAGMTYCTPPTICEGTTATVTTCRKACTQNTDCTGNTTCSPGFDGKLYCALPALVVLPRARAEKTAANAGSCAAVPGLESAVALALLGLLRRRRT